MNEFVKHPVISSQLEPPPGRSRITDWAFRQHPPPGAPSAQEQHVPAGRPLRDPFPVKNPGFTAIAVACLALGIGVNSTIFSVVDGVILSPSPIRMRTGSSPSLDQPERGVRRGGLSYADYKDLRDSNTTIASLAAFTERSLTIADSSGDPERYRGATVSWNLFQLLGAPPVEGRNFVPEEDRRGRAGRSPQL